MPEPPKKKDGPVATGFDAKGREESYGTFKDYYKARARKSKSARQRQRRVFASVGGIR